jgi:hypothetical protein
VLKFPDVPFHIATSPKLVKLGLSLNFSVNSINPVDPEVLMG